MCPTAATAARSVVSYENYKVIDIIDPSTKTLGSSEGKQTTTQKKEGEELGEDEEELPVVKGAYVFLHSGRHRGTYGVVEVVDEDHVLIRAAVGQAVLREVEGNLRVATQKEYRESSRVINKEMYDKFKVNIKIKKENKRNAVYYQFIVGLCSKGTYEVLESIFY
ncbi:Protein mos-2 [Portunus trituberculatus]|uniref:Protein mos-2 n=1 Tax=Portunus trituberculatus TaxID=210409 RepID=A0A5B7H0G7_PORTR|nr:Protein mos-2 [Portunus trituberculatus]